MENFILERGKITEVKPLQTVIFKIYAYQPGAAPTKTDRRETNRVENKSNERWMLSAGLSSFI